MGPLYFCLVFGELLEYLKSELVLGYLDDVAVDDTTEIVLKDFILLESTATRLGLEIKRSKCEVIGHTDKSRTLFKSYDANSPETNSASVVFLGSPLSAGHHLDSVLAAKTEEIQRLTRRLELLPSHDSLFLLRNVLAAPRLMYLLRTAPCCESLQLPKYDAVLRDLLSVTSTTTGGLRRHCQYVGGGIAVRSAVLLAPSAYLASAASTTELTSSLLPVRLHDTMDSGIASATSAWLRQANFSFLSPQTAVTNHNGLTLLGRPMLQSTSQHASRHCRGSCQPDSSAGCTFTRLW